MTTQSINQLIRKLSIDDKTSWLLELLSAPMLDDKHRRTILQLASRRNGFVHYKYTLSHDNRRARIDDIEKIKSDFKEIKKAVTYMLKYEQLVCFNNKFKKSARV